MADTSNTIEIPASSDGKPDFRMKVGTLEMDADQVTVRSASGAVDTGGNRGVSTTSRISERGGGRTRLFVLLALVVGFAAALLVMDKGRTPVVVSVPEKTTPAPIPVSPSKVVERPVPAPTPVTIKLKGPVFESGGRQPDTKALQETTMQGWRLVKGKPGDPECSWAGHKLRCPNRWVKE